MPRIAYYRQDCPTCGRGLRIRVEYLGRSLCCPHCRGKFKAIDPSASSYPGRVPTLNLLDRANELLDSLHLHPPVGLGNSLPGATSVRPPAPLGPNPLPLETGAPATRPPELN